MAHYSEVTLDDFQEILTPANGRSVQVISIALFLGILAFQPGFSGHTRSTG